MTTKLTDIPVFTFGAGSDFVYRYCRWHKFTVLRGPKVFALVSFSELPDDETIVREFAPWADEMRQRLPDDPGQFCCVNGLRQTYHEIVKMVTIDILTGTITVAGG